MASANDRSDKDREVDDFMAESGSRMDEPSPADAASEPQVKKRKNVADPEVRTSIQSTILKS